MNTRLIAALIVGSFVLAGCGGGGSSDSAMDMEDETPQVSETDQDRIDELQDQLTAAQQQAQQAEAARLQAEQEAAEAAARAIGRTPGQRIQASGGLPLSAPSLSSKICGGRRRFRHGQQQSRELCK